MVGIPMVKVESCLNLFHSWVYTLLQCVLVIRWYCPYSRTKWEGRQIGNEYSGLPCKLYAGSLDAASMSTREAAHHHACKGASMPALLQHTSTFAMLELAYPPGRLHASKHASIVKVLACWLLACMHAGWLICGCPRGQWMGGAKHLQAKIFRTFCYFR